MSDANPFGTLVLPFSALSRESLAVAGGKAANLGELTRAGFPVPSGFCITTEAYERVASGSSVGPILAELAAARSADPERIARLAAQAREAILQAPVPEAISRACVDAYRALGSGAAVAVRSSATAEDLPGASFAGQQDTYLNVIGEAAVLDAIRRCWASLWTERAVTYRAKQGIDPREVMLAVVVQSMVRASVAGVLFTANPVTGRRRRAVIDASPGLGEAVVSGAVNPDHFEVSTETGAVLTRRLGDKRVAVEAVSGGGTRHVTKDDGSDEACVSDVQLAALAKLGARVEVHYGAPQDIEWAIGESGALWLLQARPITTLYPLPGGAPKTDSDLRVYFSVNVAQGVLRPFTPMGSQCLRMLASTLAEHLGFPPRDQYAGPSFIAESAGRMHFDITPLVRNPIGRSVITFAFKRMEARSHTMLEALFNDARLSLRPYSKVRLAGHALRVLRRTRLPITLMHALAKPEAARARAVATAEEVLGRGRIDASASVDAKLDVIDRLLSSLPLIFVTHVPVLGAGMLAFVIAKRLLSDLSKEQENEAVFRALPHNPTTEMDLELWHLAERVRGDALSRSAVLSTPAPELAEQARRGVLPRILQEGLDAFLRRYGARGVGEIDAGVARWADDPTHILGSLVNYLALEEDAITPDAQFRRTEREAEAMVTELSRRARGRGLLRGAAVRFTLSRMRALAGMREAPKYNLVRVLGRVRELLFEIARPLVAAGHLDELNDIFMLTLPEVRAAVRGADLRSIARLRRAEHERELSRRKLPRILLSDGTEPEVPRSMRSSEGERGAPLVGTPASTGTVTAKARVILDPIGAKLAPGEILVAPSTDPGWTPLFLTAGGLVMEMGGAMSHGAVVAREYGIPAVVGVAGATHAIGTGQRIMVDGAAGTISFELAVSAEFQPKLVATDLADGIAPRMVALSDEDGPDRSRAAPASSSTHR